MNRLAAKEIIITLMQVLIFLFLTHREPKSAFVNDGFDNISNTTGVVRPMSDERSSTGSDSTNEVTLLITL